MLHIVAWVSYPNKHKQTKVMIQIENSRNKKPLQVVNYNETSRMQYFKVIEMYASLENSGSRLRNSTSQIEITILAFRSQDPGDTTPKLGD